MFKETNRQQGLFGARSQLGGSAKRRLEKSWAETFRTDVYPVLLGAESDFERLYGRTGRPNFSVARLLGIVLLQELQNLSDQAALDAYSFDVRWQHALDVTEEAYLSRRSLVEFRRRLVEQDDEMVLIRSVFDRITTRGLQRFGTNTNEQRLDSTFVASNVRIAGLLQLFDQTVRHFLKSLDDEHYARVSKSTRRWYEEEIDGYFGLGAPERRVKAAEIAKIAVHLVNRFQKRKEVTDAEPYRLLQRLVEEYCTIEKRRLPPSKGKKNRQRSYETIVRVTPKKSKGKLQTVHDPDAEYGYKGIGYSAQIAETCNNADAPEFITDYDVTGAGKSDVGKAKGVVQRLEKNARKPKVLFADAGYPTPEQLVELRASGTELFAPVHRGRMDERVMSRDRFRFDENGHVTRCPRGCKPIDHRVQNPNGDGRELHAIFDGDKCRRCPMLDRCPVRAPNHRDKDTPPRETRGNFRLSIGIAIRARDQRFAEQETDAWRDRYAIRAGIEATNSELKRAHGLGKLRVRRRPRVHFAVACKVTACNIKRWIRAALAALVSICWAVLTAANSPPPQEPTTPAWQPNPAAI